MNEVEKKEIEEMAKAICSHCLEMTKQEQIEEMGKVMPEKIKDPLDNSRYIIFGKSLRREIARIYYNAGYRKIDDDCAVITKDELKQYKVQALKEFAENLKECAKSSKKGGYDGIVEEDIDLILKDYEE